MIYDYLIAPFADFGFMRRALVASLALSIGGSSIGVFLILRRMSLMGDAMSHAILPGAAIGFLLSGLSLFAMTAGGLIAGFVVAVLAGLVARATELKEDASLAAFFLLSLAVGVTIVSMRGTNLDLMHVLLGTVLAVDVPALILIVAIASIVIAGLALIFRPVALQSLDPAFLRGMGGSESAYRAVFLVLVVLDLVAAFQAFGTLLAGVPLLLPAAAARCWTQRIAPLVCLSIGFGMVASYAGLLVSYHLNVP